MQPSALISDEYRRMQEELLQLWDDVGFTLIFVTHSIEEAVVVGSRILLLSPHPGRVRAELNVPATLHESAGGEAQGALGRRIHHLLFGEQPGREARHVHGGH